MRLVILDRDGVINYDSDLYVKSPAEWIPIPGSLNAIARLNSAGYRVVVASNQSGLARKLLAIEDLCAIHEKMYQQLSWAGGNVEAIFFCPHGPDEGCYCRKPRPGLLREIAERLHVSLQGVPCVGDALRDIQAARAVGAVPVLVRTGKGKRTLEGEGEELRGVPVYDDLASFVDALLGQEGQKLP
jgi:D-glycero-D-manno-heptose 1,7-bisphosphate phosphatase